MPIPIFPFSHLRHRSSRFADYMFSGLLSKLPGSGKSTPPPSGDFSSTDVSGNITSISRVAVAFGGVSDVFTAKLKRANGRKTQVSPRSGCR